MTYTASMVTAVQLSRDVLPQLAYSTGSMLAGVRGRTAEKSMTYRSLAIMCCPTAACIIT